MSIYNETPSDLAEAIDSILQQTYEDFEFIIVCDNPDNIRLVELVKKYELADKRVRLIENEKNIGLALSLNKAAEQASGEYLFRMDADDIAYPTRMMEQYQEMIENDLDLVCSGYDVINERSKIIRENVGFCNDETMRSAIPYQVTVHHPTVMMRKSCFDEVGGYRNYICAQDYDLWLRMWYANARMKNMHKSLLKYRIRESSITSKKRFIQKLTTDYIKDMFWQRLKTGTDEYSYDNYLDYLKKHGAYNNKKNDKFLKEYSMLSYANHLIEQGSLLKGRLIRIKVFAVSESYRRSYIGRFKTKRLLKRFL
jgi:glycosyltransferase involved in cell wall biosynthesis